MEYDCIIIGAGIGGLASALKLTSFGKKILVLERQSKPGGFVNTFKRNGFTFESAIHCIDALGKDGEIRKYLKEFDIEDKIEFIELENFAHIIYPEYNFILDFKRQNLLEFLNTNFPHEKNNILRLFNYLNKFYKEFDNFSESNLPIWIRAVGSLFFYPKLVKISKLTVRELFKKFIKDEKLFAILADLWKFIGIPPSKASALYFLLIFRGYYLEPTSYIRGGSSELIKIIVEKIKECGGDIIFNTEVKKIITDKGKKVKGVITDTKEFKAKTVISNANSIDTLTKLIDNDKVKEKYNWILNLEKSLSAFQVYLGLSTTTKKLGLNCPMLFINTTYDHEKSFLD
ncbi:MAG: NAD(P)/FAD-dependent oxidoreductase, partial [Candidatus Aenigmatarchaeota archaeon]